MTEKKTQKLNRNIKTKAGGLYRLPDLRARCYIDPVLQCWEWTGNMATDGHKAGATAYRYPRASVVPGLFGNERRTTMHARRVGWLLAGNTLNPGQVVYRCCAGSDKCVNPKHAAVANSGELQRIILQQGRGPDPARLRLAAALGAVARALPLEKFEQIREDLQADGRGSMASIARLRGVSQCVVRRINSGRHWHQRSNKVVRGASVFAMAA